MAIAEAGLITASLFERGLRVFIKDSKELDRSTISRKKPRKSTCGSGFILQGEVPMAEQYSSQAVHAPMSLVVVRRANALSTREKEASQAASSCSGFPGQRACGEGSSFKRSKRSCARDSCRIGSLDRARSCVGTVEA